MLADFLLVFSYGILFDLYEFGNNEIIQNNIQTLLFNQKKIGGFNYVTNTKKPL